MYFKHFIKKIHFNPPTPWSGRMVSGAKAYKFACADTATTGPAVSHPDP